MAIFSTFDPKFQNQILKKSIDEYGRENVIHIRKSKLFLWWVVIARSILWFLTFVAVITLIIMFVPEKFVWLIVGLCFITLGIWSIPLFKIIRYLLDYLYDFSIITPQSFIRYDQTGFFKRTSKVIDLTHIRSVSVEKAWFRNSIFNNWNIVVLSEWWDSWWPRESKEDPWKIFFRYVKNPEYYANRIQERLKVINYREEYRDNYKENNN